MTEEFSGHFKVQGERWINTTIAAHQILDALPNCANESGYLNQENLLELFGKGIVTVILDLLEKEQWIEAKDELKIDWKRTEKGDEHLADILEQGSRVEKSLADWLISKGISLNRIDLLKNNLKNVIHLFFDHFRREKLTDAARILDAIFGSEQAKLLGEDARLFKDAAQELSQEKYHPLVSFVCREVLERIFKDFYESYYPREKAHQPINIILDTNILSRLLCPFDSKNDNYMKILENLTIGREITLYITPNTIEEIKNMLIRGEDIINSLMYIPKDKRLEVRFGHPFAIQYAEEFSGSIPYSAYCDQRYLQIIDYLFRAKSDISADLDKLHVPKNKFMKPLPCKVKIINPLLFIVDLKSSDLIEEQNNAIIPENLCNAFEKNKIPLSENYTISIIKSGIEWLIKDKNEVYIIRREDNKLFVYLGFNLLEISESKQELKTWPSFEHTLSWMEKRKKPTTAKHDAILYSIALYIRHKFPNDYSFIWTADSWFTVFEYTKLKSYSPEQRLFRDTQMVQAIWTESITLDKLFEDTMETLTNWAISSRPNVDYYMTTALELMQGIDRNSYDEYKEETLEFIRGADPYNVLKRMLEQEPEDEIGTAMEKNSKIVDQLKLSESVKEINVESQPGWPEIKNGQTPSPKQLDDADMRLNNLALIPGWGAYLDLSGDWEIYTATHGPLPIKISKQIPIGTGKSIKNFHHMELQIGVHVIPHFDLPWAITQNPQGSGVSKDFRPNYATAQAHEIHESILSPQERDAIIIDLRYKSSSLQGMIEEIDGDWFLSNLGISKIKDILGKLWISKKDILERLNYLEGSAQLNGKWLVFHTGWPELFHPVLADLSNPGFECWHTWTLHPYIDVECAKWLLDQGVYGIVTDTAMIDCPAYIMPRATGILGHLGNVYQFLLESQSNPNDSTKPRLSEYQPAHLLLLLNLCPMIESISIPSEILCKYEPDYEKFGIIKRPLFTIGLGMHQMLDGALAKVNVRLGDKDNDR